MKHHHLLALVFLLLAAAGGSQAHPKPKSPAVSPVDFVRRSCRSTRYPRVCESTLLPCAPAVGRSPRRLARAALVVGADRAGNWSSHIRGGGGAMNVCGIMARIAEEQLRKSVAEIERMGRAGTRRFAASMGNVQTWASAALTDTDTCLDTLDQDRGSAASDKDAVRRWAVAVAQVTSNALALVVNLDPARRHGP